MPHSTGSGANACSFALRMPCFGMPCPAGESGTKGRGHAVEAFFLATLVIAGSVALGSTEGIPGRGGSERARGYLDAVPPESSSEQGTMPLEATPLEAPSERPWWHHLAVLPAAPDKPLQLQRQAVSSGASSDALEKTAAVEARGGGGGFIPPGPPPNTKPSVDVFRPVSAQAWAGPCVMASRCGFRTRRTKRGAGARPRYARQAPEGAASHLQARSIGQAPGGHIRSMPPAGCATAGGCSDGESSDAGPGWPCPAGCICSSSMVNCSWLELTEIPATDSCPPDAVILDLSHNKLKTVLARDFAGFPGLLHLDLSFNRIVAIEEGAFLPLQHLRSLKLGSNRMLCDCTLRWLADWVRENEALIVDSELLRCSQQVASSSGEGSHLLHTNFTAQPCADSYIACATDPEGSRDAVLLFSRIGLGPHTTRTCQAFCFLMDQSHYGLDEEDHCLCGSLGSGESLLMASIDAGRACAAVCSNTMQSQVCNRTVIHALYPVQATFLISAPRHSSVHQAIDFTAESTVPVTQYQWDFGDGSRILTSRVAQVTHKYGLPGTYHVTAHAQVGEKILRGAVVVRLSMPVAQAELECPQVVETGHSIDIWMHIYQGTDLYVLWKMEAPDGLQTLDESSCPRGGRVHLENLNCYWLVQTKESWKEARQLCQATPGGDLALVKSPDVQHFLQEAFPGAGSVWIGLGETSSSGPLHWVDRSPLDSFQNWGAPMLPGRDQDCVQLNTDLKGAWKSSPCQRKSSFLCEKKAGTALPSGELFLAGVSTFTASNEVKNVSSVAVLPPLGGDTVELMLFPGLWFSHTGTLVSLEFGTQALKATTQVRFQVFRPYCALHQHLVPPGCEFLRSPFASCQPRPLCNTTGGCPPGQQWCPLSETCLNVSSPCSSYAFENVTSNILPIPNPPRFKGASPSYSQVADVPMLLGPVTDSYDIQVLLSGKEITVYPDDIIGIQHTAGTGALLRCQKNLLSPWRQSYLSLEGVNWWEGRVTKVSDNKWVDNIICDLRVTFTYDLRSFAVSPLLSEQVEPGIYAYTAVIQNAVSETQVTCEVEMQSRIAGLQIIHPLPVSGKLHLATDIKTMLVIKIMSGTNATAHWLAPVDQAAVSFQPSCPSSILSSVPACRRDTSDCWFSSILAFVSDTMDTTLNILVSNQISSQNLSVKMQTHDVIASLRVVPSGPRRMLVDIPQVFSATVGQGSSVSYTWTIDDVERFAYIGSSYSLRLRKPGTYTLMLHAQNPVSSDTLEIQLLADAMKRLHDPQISGLPKVLPVNTPQRITFQVKVDMAVEVTIRWNFGDGSAVVEDSWHPPYDPAILELDLEGDVVSMLSRVTHTYRQPGDYNLTIQAFNNYDSIQRMTTIRVLCPITFLELIATPTAPLVNQSVQFEVFPKPSAFGLTFSWDFGDGSPQRMDASATVRHRFSKSGQYRVSARVGHSLNEVMSDVIIEVGKSMVGLQITSSAPSELGTTTTINATVESGTNVRWSFDMGDGALYRNQSLGYMSHSFTREGNYTVTVVASDSATSTRSHLSVEIYRFQITGILAPAVVARGELIFFQAFVSGPVSRARFHWDFGDLSSSATVKEDAMVYHKYASAGSFLLNLTVSGTASSDSVQSMVRVEDRIHSVEVTASVQHAALGSPICFYASVIPEPDLLHRYSYIWDSGMGDAAVSSSSPEISFTYIEEGIYRVTATAKNSLGSESAFILVTAQRSISNIVIHHSGDTGHALALNSSYCFRAEVVSGAATRFTWDFGDGAPSQEGSSTCHSYSQAGNFTITVNGENPVSSKAATLPISVLTPVTTLSVLADCKVGRVGQALTFHASVSAGDNVQYLWAVCDSCEFKAGLATLKISFPVPGIVTLRVQVKNAVSVKDAKVSLEIQEQVRGVLVHSEELVLGKYLASLKPFTMAVKVEQGTNVSFRWAISQGSSHSFYFDGPSVTYTCNSSGELLVEVWAGNSLGQVSESLALSVVEIIHDVAIKAQPKCAALGDVVNFTVSVSGGTDLEYSWNLGEGSQVVHTNTSSISHIFLSPGVRIISVTVSNVLGSISDSVELGVEEPVTGVDISVAGYFPPFFVRSNTTVQLQGSVAEGTNVLWEWRLQKGKEQLIFLQQNFSYFLEEAGVYHVLLQAWNNLSSDTVEQTIQVQQEVSGLQLKVDRTSACSGETVNFSLHVSRGTNVSFILNITSKELVIDVHDGTIPLTMSQAVPRHQLVVATASNKVSQQTASVEVQVLEKIGGLHLLDCCAPYLESMKTLEFTAALLSGQDVSFHWAFHLPRHPNQSETGQQVWYTPAGEGNLTVHLEASNAFCSESLTTTIALQLPVKSAALSANGTVTFINQTVSFEVVFEGGSELSFQWSFGDLSEAYNSKDTKVFHRYKHAGNYSATVMVYNGISQAVVHILVTVQELACEQPQVQLVQPPYTVYRSSQGYFEATVDLKTCTAYMPQYLWQVYRSPDCQDLHADNQVPLSHVDLSNLLLVLPKRTLDIGTYCLRFVLSLQGTALAQYCSTTLNVLQSELVPVIRGGSHRDWSAEVDLVMDGSGSCHADVGLAEECSALEYHWKWELKNASAHCALHSLPVTYGANVTIPSAMLCADTAYFFTLTVRKEGREPALATQTVWIQSGTVLPVVLECRSCSALSSYHVSRSVHVTLSARCEDCHSVTQYKWTAQSSHGLPLILDNATTSTGDANRDLVIRQGVLWDGINYTFTVTAFQPSTGLRGGASITLTPNNPPSMGRCSFYPEKDIYLLETLVSYNCSGWTDEDGTLGQLIYTLVAETCSRDEKHCQRFCLYRGTKTSVSTLLPAGHGTGHSTVSIYLELEDLQGAKTVALNRTLTVNMPSVSGFHTFTGWLKNKSQSELWGLAHQGNPQEVIPYSLALASALNQDSPSDRSEGRKDLEERISIRCNITEVLTSMKISSVTGVTQLSAALAQCVAIPEELTPESHGRVLEAAARMINVLDDETEEGHETPIPAGRNILGILGRTFTTMNAAPENRPSTGQDSESALSTFHLTRALMKSLMKSRVLNEETLSLSVAEINVQGKRIDSKDLLCTNTTEDCHFSLPTALATQLADSGELIQVMIDYSLNPYPFERASNASVSTHLASLEFSTPSGAEVPVSNLSDGNTILVRLPTRNGAHLNTNGTSITISAGESVNFTVSAEPESGRAGVHIHIEITLPDGFDNIHESNPSVTLCGNEASFPSQIPPQWSREVLFSQDAGGFRRDVTVMLSRYVNGSSGVHHVSISSQFVTASARAVITLLCSLCQYFDFQSQSWRTEGVTSTDATIPTEVICRTEHLSVFGASLFVPAHTVVFLPPSKGPRQNHLVLITCSVFFFIYLVMVLISHKLDDIDIARVGIIPLCGQPGRYKYWVMVKTGWKQDAGTSSHVGISLYGLNKSGSRHLDKNWAFQRNSHDNFQVETDANLGEIWKIRIWHDNTGINPSWYLQHVTVWDKQTDVLYYFLVEDWLSVENEKNEGMVEKEVLAACPQELRSFARIFFSQLRLGISDRHLWWSVWSRPPQSRFTRVQRISCCLCSLYLIMTTCILWYGSVGVTGSGSPLGSQAMVTVESIAVGMVIAVVIFPVQLLLTFLFRKTHSKAVVEVPDPSTPDSQTIEMDVCLNISELGSSSFLSIPRGLESMMDISSLSRESFVSRKGICSPENPLKLNESFVKNWTSCDSIFDIPDLLNSDPLVTRSRILKRKKAILTLGMESPSSSDDDPMSFSDSSQKSSYDHLSMSEEDLINSIVTCAHCSEESDKVTSDSGRFSPQADADLISDILESRCSSWSEAVRDTGQSSWSYLHKSFSCASMVTSLGSALLLDHEPPSAPATSFCTRIGVPRERPAWLFPSWMLSVTYSVLFMCVVLCLSILALYGSGLTERVVLLWFISSAFAVLTSFILLEPLKVILEALRKALIVKPVHSEAEGLVENPLIRKMPERVGKVRAPCGYGLLQAKEEARKVRALRGLMKSCLLHMLFLLLVLLVNYQGCFHDNNIRRLHATIKQSVTTTTANGLNFTAIQGSSDLWRWIDLALLPVIYGDSRITLVGAPRLRQVCSDSDLVVDPPPFLSSTLARNRLHGPPAETVLFEQPEDHCSNLSPSNSSHGFIRFCFFGHLGIYGSNEGAWRELGTGLSEAQRTLHELKDIQWITERSRAVFVEFTQYYADVDLYVAISLLTEFSPADPVATSTIILPFHMSQLTSSLDLRLTMMALLFLFSVGFLIPELLTLSHEQGCSLAKGRYCIQVLLVLLSVGVGTIHSLCVWYAGLQMEHYRNNQQSFTSFYEVALLAKTEACLSAMLLMVLMLKIVQQLRFVRRWSAFGKTFHLTLGELLTATSLMVLLLLIYAQCGYLAFSATTTEFRSVHAAFFTLLSVLHGRTNIQTLWQASPFFGGVYILSYMVIILGLGSRLLCTVVLHGYRSARAGTYRPAIESQDYEMVEFCMKRFKLWLGLSKAKEFRHKVKFEGMESLPSRCSRLSKHSPLPTAGEMFQSTRSSISSGSFRSEELALPESPEPELRTLALYLERLPSTVNNLLDQFDRVNRVLDDVCHLEMGLQQAQKRMNASRKAQREKEQLEAEKKAAQKPVKKLDLPRTYSTFSESALARLRSSRIKVSSTDGNKIFQYPSGSDSLAAPISWLRGPPRSYDICLNLRQGPGAPWKWRPKSEEGQAGMCREITQRHIPLKRRAWQTDGHSEM